jgi:hypothetical protein
VDWIDLVLEKDRWRALENTVMILCVLYIAVNLLSN